MMLLLFVSFAGVTLLYNHLAQMESTSNKSHMSRADKISAMDTKESYKYGVCVCVCACWNE